jgi:hypothetical protein
VYILYRALLCIHSLPEWDILILGGQYSIIINYNAYICDYVLDNLKLLALYNGPCFNDS